MDLSVNINSKPPSVRLSHPDSGSLDVKLVVKNRMSPPPLVL